MAETDQYHCPDCGEAYSAGAKIEKNDRFEGYICSNDHYWLADTDSNTVVGKKLEEYRPSTWTSVAIVILGAAMGGVVLGIGDPRLVIVGLLLGGAVAAAIEDRRWSR